MKTTEIEIVPEKSFSFNFRDLWLHRELLYFFAWRDVKVKYKQTYLGILWAMLQPLCLMAIFYFVFFRALNIRTGTVPYPLYVFSGLLLWGLFSSGITNSSESMLSNSHIIRKIYFPRLLIPFSSVAVALVDFAFGSIILMVLFIVYRQPVPAAAIYCVPLGVLMTLLSSLGIGSLLAALNVKYRDFRYVLPFAMQILFFASQVVYPIDNIDNTWFKYALYFHPFNGALEVFNYALQPDTFNATGVLISCIMMTFLLAAGLIYFKKTEMFFADIV